MATRATSFVFLVLFPLFEIACYSHLHWNRNDLRVAKRIKSAIYVASLAGWLAYFNVVVSTFGVVPCGLFYVSSLLVAPLSVGPQIIRALTLRGTIKYYQLVIEDEISSRTRRVKEAKETKVPGELFETGLSLTSGKKAEATLIMERTRWLVKMTILALLVVPTLFIILAIAITSDARRLLETDLIQCQPEPNSFQYTISALVIISAVLALAIPFLMKKIDDELHIAAEIGRNSIFLGFTHILIVVVRFLGHYEWQPLMQTIQQMILFMSMAIIPFIPRSPTLDRISSWAKQRGQRINPATKSATPGYGRPIPRSREYIGPRMSRRLSHLDQKLDREATFSWDAGLCVLLSSEDGISMFIQHCAKEFSSENILFWCAVNDYKEKYDKEYVIHDEINDENPSSPSHVASSSSNEEIGVGAVAREIYNMFIDINSAIQVNLSSKQKTDIKNALDSEQWKRETFDVAQKEIFSVMSRDSYPRFLSSKKKKMQFT